MDEDDITIPLYIVSRPYTFDENENPIKGAFFFLANGSIEFIPVKEKTDEEVQS